MKSLALKCARPAGLALFAATLLISPNPVPAQAPWPFAPPPPMPVPRTPDAQRNQLNNLRTQINYLQNTTRSASKYATGAVDMLWQQFQVVRGSFHTLKMTLTPPQLAYGANELAELDAGLDIIQEVFAYYQDDLASGRPPYAALRDLCNYLRQASGVWLQQLNTVSSQLRIGS